MMTVHEVSKLTGVSIRTLQYYDKIGLLSQAQYTDAGYRLYDDAALETLQQILLFRELEFPLRDIKEIIGSLDYDRSKAQALVKRLQDFITKHFYTCTDEILSGLSKMYAGGGDFTTNIDNYGGKGTAEFVRDAVYVNRT